MNERLLINDFHRLLRRYGRPCKIARKETNEYGEYVDNSTIIYKGLGFVHESNNDRYTTYSISEGGFLPSSKKTMILIENVANIKIHDIIYIGKQTYSVVAIDDVFNLNKFFNLSVEVLT